LFVICLLQERENGKIASTFVTYDEENIKKKNINIYLTESRGFKPWKMGCYRQTCWYDNSPLKIA